MNLDQSDYEDYFKGTCKPIQLLWLETQEQEKLI